MKKLLAAFSAVTALGLTATQAAETLTVATTPVPRTEIPNVIKPSLAKEGVELKAKEFIDYVQPNVQASEKRLDADLFQHQSYLNELNEAKGTDLVAVTGVYIEPLGAYLSKYKKLDELPSGVTVVIPNGATNGGRALLPLDKAGVIRLKDNGSIIAMPEGIVDNPKNTKIHELEAATLSHALTRVDMALISTNYALGAKLNPTKDVLAIEGNDSSYVNTFVARPGNKDGGAMQKLARVLHGAEVKQLTQEKYKSAAVPAF